VCDGQFLGRSVSQSVIDTVIMCFLSRFSEVNISCVCKNKMFSLKWLFLLSDSYYGYENGGTRAFTSDFVHMK
jgi:hypothetical protein